MRMTLGEACHFYSGTGFPEMYQGVPDGEFPFFKVGDISANVSEGNTYLERCSNYISADVVTAIHGTIIPPDTVVFAKIGEALKKNRRAITTRESLVDNNAMGIAPRKELLRIRYFYYFMCRLQMERFAEATAVPSVRKSRLEQICLDVPSFEKQMYIENVLDAVSSVIKIRQRQLRVLDTLIKARFVEMFGDPIVRLERGETIQLDRIADKITVGFVGEASNDYSEDGIPYLRTQNVRVNRIDLDGLIYVNESFHNHNKKSIIHPGDVVVSRVGANRGMAAVIPESLPEANIANCLIVGQTKSVNPYYLAFYLNMSFGKRPQFGASVGSAQGVINTAILKKWEVFVPNMQQQSEFNDFARQVDKSKVVVQKALDEAQLLFDSLMQKYFG